MVFCEDGLMVVGAIIFAYPCVLVVVYCGRRWQCVDLVVACGERRADLEVFVEGALGVL